MTTIHSTVTFTKVLPNTGDAGGEVTLMTSGNTHVIVTNAGVETLVTGNLVILQPTATVDGYVTMTNVPITIGRNYLNFFRSSNDDLNTSGATIHNEGKASVKRIADESVVSFT